MQPSQPCVIARTVMGAPQTWPTWRSTSVSFGLTAQESNILTVHVSRGHVLNRREEPGNSVNALAVRQSGAPMLAAAGERKMGHPARLFLERVQAD
eukprot:317622-Pelagomonas_calceolata.AAC.3